MGKSKKKAIYKDVGIGKKRYHKTCRSVINKQIREISKLEDTDEYEIENEKTIINDYDYSDYKFIYEYSSNNEKYAEKLRRK